MDPLYEHWLIEHWLIEQLLLVEQGSTRRTKSTEVVQAQGY